MNKGIQRLVVAGLAMFALSAYAGVKEQQAACEKGDHIACDIVFAAHTEGLMGADMDARLAAKYLQRSCELKRGQAEVCKSSESFVLEQMKDSCNRGNERHCKYLEKYNAQQKSRQQSSAGVTSPGGGSVPPPNRSTAAAPRNEGGIVEGSRVQCNWRNLGKLYPGTVAQKNGDAVFIHYDDGDQENTRTGMCKLMAGETASAPNPSGLKVGSRVVCNWKARGTFYSGTITRLNGAAAHIKYDDGDEEDTNINHCQGADQNNNANTSSRAGMRRK